MIIRSAKREDAPAIASYIAMAEGEMVDFFTGTADPEKAVKRIEEYVLSPKTNRYGLEQCLVAEIDGRAEGMILLFPADAQSELDKPVLEALKQRGLDFEHLTFEGVPGTFYLSTMAVNPAIRGKGIGSALLKAGMERGRELGYSQVSLLVSKDKPRARTLYERIGFAIRDEVSMGDSHYYRMVRDIPAS